MVFAQLKLKLESNKPSSHSTETIKVLLDSGASATLLKASWLPKLKTNKSNSRTQWINSTGKIETKYKA
jgi:hypothetical protein